MTQESKDDYRESTIKMAKREQTVLRAIKLLVKSDDDYPISLKIDGLVHHFSSSHIFLPIIDHEIQEIQKAIKGKPNKWE